MYMNETEHRKIIVPASRFSQIKKNWEEICKNIVDGLLLQIKMNLKTSSIEIRTCKETVNKDAIQKAEDFIRAVLTGFSVSDAMVLIKLNDLYVDSFEIKDVKTLKNEHLPRAIGRIVGTNGKTKLAIENTTKTRIIVSGQKISILGSCSSIELAKNALTSLILGKPPGKIYNRLRMIAVKRRERALF